MDVYEHLKDVKPCRSPTFKKVVKETSQDDNAEDSGRGDSWRERDWSTLFLLPSAGLFAF